VIVEEQSDLDECLKAVVIDDEEIKKQRILPQPIRDTNTNEVKVSIDVTQPKQQRPKRKPKPNYPTQGKTTRKLIEEMDQILICQITAEESKKKVKIKPERSRLICKLDITYDEEPNKSLRGRKRKSKEDIQYRRKKKPKSYDSISKGEALTPKTGEKEISESKPPTSYYQLKPINEIIVDKEQSFDEDTRNRPREEKSKENNTHKKATNRIKKQPKDPDKSIPNVKLKVPSQISTKSKPNVKLKNPLSTTISLSQQENLSECRINFSLELNKETLNEISLPNIPSPSNPIHYNFSTTECTSRKLHKLKLLLATIVLNRLPRSTNKLDCYNFLNEEEEAIPLHIANSNNLSVSTHIILIET
jgi:hypothetical protein